MSLPPDFMNFDLIECSGVLHHLDDPQEGLRHLSGRLATNGVMKVALYSALARKVFEPVNVLFPILISVLIMIYVRRVL